MTRECTHKKKEQKRICTGKSSNQFIFSFFVGWNFLFLFHVCFTFFFLWFFHPVSVFSWVIFYSLLSTKRVVFHCFFIYPIHSRTTLQQYFSTPFEFFFSVYFIFILHSKIDETFYMFSLRYFASFPVLHERILLLLKHFPLW